MTWAGYQTVDRISRSTTLDPSNKLIRLNRAAADIIRREKHDLDALRALRQEFPERADVAAILSRNLAVRPRGLGEAKILLTKAETLDKNCSQIPFARAMIALAEKRYIEYLTIIQELRRIDPGDQNMIRAECLGLVCVGNFEDAEMLARRCLDGGHLPATFAATCLDLVAYSLTLQGRAVEAESWARQAADSHAVFQGLLDGKQNMGLFQSLLQQGKFDEALAIRPPAREGENSIGVVLSGATNLVADSVLKRMIEIREHILAGDLNKLGQHEMALTPDIAFACGMPRLAFPLYRQLFGQNLVPLMENLVANMPSPLYVNEFYQLSIRMNAARAAIRAACDPLKEPFIQFRAESRKEARMQGLIWLQIEVERLKTSRQKPSERSRINGISCFLQRCPDFKGVRDTVQLEKLPKDERALWANLWAEVDEIRETIRYRNRPD